MSGKPRENIIGQTFGAWTVVAAVPGLHRGKLVFWHCRCVCGVERDVSAYYLRWGKKNDKQISCGCIKAKKQSERLRLPFNEHRFITDTVVEIDLYNAKGVVTARTLIDASDLAFVSKHRWVLGGDGYAMTKIARRMCAMHRMLLQDERAAHPGLNVDHISRDRLDNRRSNLRLVTTAQNSWNAAYTPGESGYVGVHRGKRDGLWNAVLKCNGVFYRKSGFTDPAEAARWRDAEVKRLRGEFAILNFPREEC